MPDKKQQEEPQAATAQAEDAPAKKPAAAKAAAKPKAKKPAAAKSSAPKAPPPGARYFRGTGRRKNAIATVKLYNTPGQGSFTVNDKPIQDLLRVDEWVQDALKPLEVTSLMDDVTISARSYGGGLHGQAGALSLGIARALLAMNEELRPVLRQHSLLTRDARARESKKYGLKRARKAPQYTKR